MNPRSPALLTSTALAIACAAAHVAVAQPVVFTQISTNFNTPVGIDYYEPANAIVVSVNYPSGNPRNFELINFDGSHSAFSTLSGYTDEVKIATVRSGNIGGFTSGDLFTGNGIDGQIARITNNGTTVINPFVDLPGAGNGLMRGSLFVDRYGVAGGDLIAATTGGELWRVNSAGAATKLADVGVHLEGLQTIPNLPIYGGLAGKIIAGAEGQGRLYVFDPNVANSFTYHNIGVNIEDIDLINANENFFGVNFGTGRILGAEASQFSSMVGDILLTQEFPSGGSGLYRMSWDAVLNKPVATQLSIGATSATVGQWEHVTFAPAGIVEIPPTTVPEAGSTFLLAAAGLLLVAGVARRKQRLPS